MSETSAPRHACTCCGYLTLLKTPDGSYEICPVCFWEDDVTQNADPDYAGGANRFSLRTSQENFARLGAVEERLIPFVREPRANEIR